MLAEFICVTIVAHCSKHRVNGIWYNDWGMSVYCYEQKEVIPVYFVHGTCT